MPKLLEQLHTLMRVRHYSVRTEEAYAHWIKQYIFFHKKRHPAEMGAPEVTAFLSHLARRFHAEPSLGRHPLPLSQDPPTRLALAGKRGAGETPFAITGGLDQGGNRQGFVSPKRTE